MAILMKKSEDTFFVENQMIYNFFPNYFCCKTHPLAEKREKPIFEDFHHQ